jgi:superfamily I DNA/RNA helicase
MSRVWSHYQEAIFDFNSSGTGNGIVEAKPGSGKTTVTEECVNRIPENETVLAVAFNRHIRDELETRMEDMLNVTVHTLNSFGNSVCRDALGWYKVNQAKVFNLLKFDIFKLKTGTYTKQNAQRFWAVQSSIVKLIGLAKGHMIWTREDLERSWQQLADEYDIDLPPKIKLDVYEGILLQVFELDQQKTKVIDYDDQIAIPLRRDLPIPTFDRVFVDEAQDLTPAQIELTSRAICSTGRALYVGDTRQAIYQFRGADSRAMANIRMMMDCTELPLSICYRCCKAVVRAAQRIDSTIEWAPDAPEGEEVTISEDKFRKQAAPGNAVLCRTTAPLIESCLFFIKGGIKAVVKGRDFGANLEALVKDICKGHISMRTEKFLELLNEYHLAQVQKLKRSDKEDKLIILEDRIDTIKAIMSECPRVEDILDRCAALIVKETKDDAINHMTIHKAKGLEADVVFILRPDQLPHKLAKSEEAKRAERNLKFVAITRAISRLVWVHHNNPDDVSDGGIFS